ncbi:MAG: NAD(P)-dependent oxidoreductase [Vicinamibacterales bacterium]
MTGSAGTATTSGTRRVLLTGAAGYIGSVVARQLLERGHAVRGLDALNFGGDALLSFYNHPRFEFIKGDVRDEATCRQALAGVDGVAHLAAIVGDPACSKQPDLAKDTNWEASVALSRLAEETGVERFVFASTCSNYGKMLNADGFVNEESVLNPVSLYAELKVKFERHLLERTWQAPFCPTSLRFSTVYGLSPRMRFDLTVNEFIRDATLGRDLRVFGEQFWRPYCHVEDLARSVVMSLEADRAKVDRQVFNVGATNENYQKKMIVDELLKVVPSCQVNYVAVNEDPRDYRVDFTKIGRELGFSITKRVIDGLREINRALGQGVIADGDAPRYRNI